MYKCCNDYKKGCCEKYERRYATTKKIVKNIELLNN